jgi:hypothetical protein
VDLKSSKITMAGTNLYFAPEVLKGEKYLINF